MKKTTLLLTLITVMCCGHVMAQNNAIDKYYETYKEDDRFTRITVSSKMFSLFTNFDMDDPDEQHVVEAISRLKGLKMLVGNDVENPKSLYLDALKKPEKEMEELMTVENTENELKFFISESEGMISELLLVSFSEKNVMMMSLVGEIDLKDISDLSKKIDIQGFEQLEHAGEKK